MRASHHKGTLSKLFAKRFGLLGHSGTNGTFLNSKSLNLLYPLQVALFFMRLEIEMKQSPSILSSIELNLNLSYDLKEIMYPVKIVYFHQIVYYILEPLVLIRVGHHFCSVVIVRFNRMESVRNVMCFCGWSTAGKTGAQVGS